jgi:hypothetical protein
MLGKGDLKFYTNRSDEYHRRNVHYIAWISLLECSQGGTISEGLGSNPGSIIYQLCDLTSPLSLVLLTSDRKITPCLPHRDVVRV